MPGSEELVIPIEKTVLRADKKPLRVGPFDWLKRRLIGRGLAMAKCDFCDGMMWVRLEDYPVHVTCGTCKMMMNQGCVVPRKEKRCRCGSVSRGMFGRLFGVTR